MEGESLEHLIRFDDHSYMTISGTVDEVMEAVNRRVGSKVATEVRSRIMSPGDDVLATGCADNLDFISTRYMLTKAVSRAERIKATRFTLQFPQWEPLAATGG